MLQGESQGACRAEPWAQASEELDPILPLLPSLCVKYTQAVSPPHGFTISCSSQSLSLQKPQRRPARLVTSLETLQGIFSLSMVLHTSDFTMNVTELLKALP